MYADLLNTLKKLPQDRKAVVVVRSMPFGDIIEDDSRYVHGRVEQIRQGDWQWVAYGLCRAAKGDSEYEAQLAARGYI